MISQDLTLAIAKLGVGNPKTEPINSVRELCVYHNSVIDRIANIDKNDDSQKTAIPALYAYDCEGKHTYDNFTKSNVVIIDLDDKPIYGYNYEYTARLFENPEYFGTCVMPSILFIQKSCNGATHIAVKVPMAETKEQYVEYAKGAAKVFKSKFKEEFGVTIPEDEHLIDTNSNRCTQACFLSPHKIINCDGVNTEPLSESDMVDMDSYFGYLKKDNGVSDGPVFCSHEQTPSAAADDNNFILNKKEDGDESEHIPNQSLNFALSVKTTQDRNDIQEPPLKNGGFLENVTDCESEHIPNQSLNFALSVKMIPPPPNEYKGNFEGESKINNFAKDTDNVIETKLIMDKHNLNYNISTGQLECIKDNVIGDFDSATKGRLLLNLSGMFDGIVDVKMKFFFRRNNKNEIVKLEQGQHRRLHLKRYIKQTILNGIAKYNYDKVYDKYIISDVIYTIKWLLNNAIEVKGKTRSIDSNVVKKCIADVCDNWDSFYVEYDTNRYVCKPIEKITSFRDLQKYWDYLKKKRYEAIDNTFMYFCETLKLKGKKYSDIAQAMNDNNVEAKTDKGWTYKSVRAYASEISNVSDYSVIIEEMIGQGKKYAEIAEKLNEEGYTTKQGKAFNAKSIENYVARKK